MSQILGFPSHSGNYPSARVEGKIASYAERVGQSGFFLDLLDGMLFATKMEKELALILDTGDRSSKPILARDHISQLLPPELAIEPSHPFDPKSKNWWCLVSCNALHDPEGVANHWVPAIFREQLTEDEEFLLSAEATRKCRREVIDKRGKIYHLDTALSQLGEEPDFDEFIRLSSQKDALEQELTSLQNWLRLHESCSKQGVLPLSVPGDGNCMIWSLRCLELVYQHSEIDFPQSSRQAHKEQKQIRHTLKHMWLDVKGQEAWQVLFEVMYPEYTREDPIRTPEKKHKPSDSTIDLSTPDHAESKKVERIGACKRLPITEKPPASTALKMPGPKRPPPCFESSVPDLEEAFQNAHKLPPEHAAENREPACVDFDDEVSDDGVSTRNRKRAKHARKFKTRYPSEREKRLKSLTAFFAAKGLTYHEFVRKHQSGIALKKSAICADEGWASFKERLAGLKFPECTACQQILEWYGLSKDSLEQFFSNPEELAKQVPVPAEQAKGADSGAGPQPDADPEEEIPEVDQVRKYMATLAPVIQLVDEPNKPFQYRCTVCRSRKQPEGKLNKLSSKIHQAKWLMNKHLNSDTHIQKVNELQGSGNGVEVEAEDQIASPCPASCLSNPYSGGSLAFYSAEFHLYALHADLSGSDHKVWCETNSSKWFIRHRECRKVLSGQPLSEFDCCSKCKSLGQARDVQKRVLRFSAKYNAALLLKVRLFGTQADVDELTNKVSQSAWGTRCSVWKTLLKTKNAELQQFVRKTWSHAQECKTPLMDQFEASVVAPCLRVHVSAVHSSVACLSSQFVNALAENSQSVSKLCL